MQSQDGKTSNIFSLPKERTSEMRHVTSDSDRHYLIFVYCIPTSALITINVKTVSFYTFKIIKKLNVTQIHCKLQVPVLLKPSSFEHNWKTTTPLVFLKYRMLPEDSLRETETSWSLKHIYKIFKF
jgi:hypothetical protein